jgi:hypothetical protein
LSDVGSKGGVRHFATSAIPTEACSGSGHPVGGEVERLSGSPAISFEPDFFVTPQPRPVIQSGGMVFSKFLTYFLK